MAPCNLRNLHWTLDVVDLEEQVAIIYESWMQQIYISEAEARCDEVIDPAVNKWNEATEKQRCYWKYEAISAPVQSHGHNCGIVVVWCYLSEATGDFRAFKCLVPSWEALFFVFERCGTYLHPPVRVLLLRAQQKLH